MTDIDISRRLAANLADIRQRRNLSQSGLARQAGLPRSTVTHIESGSGNPSIKTLSLIADTLTIGLDELLAQPRAPVKLIKSNELKRVDRSGGQVTVTRLLPERTRGMEIDRMDFEPRSSMKGAPHVQGSKEYCYCLRGEIQVLIAGTLYPLSPEDVLAFSGDQAHSYLNRINQETSIVCVVVPVHV